MECCNFYSYYLEKWSIDASGKIENMDEPHFYSKNLLGALFSDEEKKLLGDFEIALRKGTRKDLEMLWEYDKSLGGLGGYAMPSNPVNNPFNTWGEERNVFRSVQYAKFDLLITGVARARHTVFASGESLELTGKYLLDKRSVISRHKNNMMYGRIYEKLFNKNMIDSDSYRLCMVFGKLYNVSKHNISEEHDRTFVPADSIIAYFSLRKLHNNLLATVGHPSLQKSYEIYQDSKDDYQLYANGNHEMV